MDMHLFFEGKLGREEVASAFLATLLEQRGDARNAFLDLVASSVGQPAVASLKAMPWKVRVEEGQVEAVLLRYYRLVPATPGLFTQKGMGTGTAAATRATDGTLITALNPARRGDIIPSVCHRSR